MTRGECDGRDPNRGLPLPRILRGAKVLEFASVPGGSLACSLMACMGSDVILVEVGQASRLTEEADQRRDACGRGKRLLTINLSHPEAAEVLHRVVKRIDVVVSDLDRRTAGSLGVDYPTLASVNLSLVYMDAEAQVEQFRTLRVPAGSDRTRQN